jgi:cytochrome c553
MFAGGLSMRLPESPLLSGLILSGQFFFFTPGVAADAGAGRSAATACAECHEPRDWEGETQASLESLIRDVVKGSVKHARKISLSDAEIANIAAYWASAAK